MTWSVANYNPNPNLNTAINGVDISEECAAEGYNDALRQIMADIATWVATGLGTLGGLPAAYIRLLVVNKSSNFSPAVGESGTAYNWLGTTGTMTLQPSSSVAMTPGDTMYVRVGTGTLNVVRGSGVTLWKNGVATSADATMPTGSEAAIKYWGSDFWSIIGVGIS